MSKRKSTQSVLVAPTEAPSGYVTVSTGGFPPNWTPEQNGESITIIPIAIRAMKGKKKGKQGYVFDAELSGEQESQNFTQGTGKNQVQVECQSGTVISVNLNAALVGESPNDRKIAYLGKKQKQPAFTLLSEKLIEKRLAARLIYHGTVPLGGGRTVKRFEIQVPSSLLTQ